MNHKITPLFFYLDLIRWIAAMFVVIGHLRSLLFCSYQNVEYKTISIKIFYFLTSLGHESVVVFFILSGYLVGGKLIKEVKTNNFKWNVYLIKRITRLYVVLIPALVVGFSLDYIGIKYFNLSEIYSNSFSLPSLNYNVEDRVNLNTFILNLLMLQKSFSNTFGSNGPLWSLAYEFWYYILFPTILIIYNYKNSSFHIIIISSILLTSILLILNIQIIIYLGIWIIGAILSYFKKAHLKLRFSIPILLITLIIIKSNIIVFTELNDLLLAVSISIIINSIQNKELKTHWEKLNLKLADFSFTLYLFHYPFIVFLISIIMNDINIINSQPSLINFSTFLIILIVTYIYSYIFYLFFEKNTSIVRSQLLNKLKKRDSDEN